MTTSHQRPEGALIEEARLAMHPRMSKRQAARAAGMSEGRWRQIVNGYASAGGGQIVTVVAPDDTLANMANVVGLKPDDLRRVGCDRAAAQLAGIQARIDPQDVESRARRALNPGLNKYTDVDLLDEIRTRMLLMASQLEASGQHALGWELDREGLLQLVSRLPEKGS